MLSPKHSSVEHLVKTVFSLKKKKKFLIWTWHGCLLGCEADVGRLATWWAALKHTLRIKLFIQNGDMHSARLTPRRGFYLLQLSFTGQSPSTRGFLSSAWKTISTKVSVKIDVHIMTILDLIELWKVWNRLLSAACSARLTLQILEWWHPRRGLDFIRSPALMEIRKDIHLKIYK